MPAPVVAALRAAGCVYAEEEARLLAEAAGSAGELDAMVRRRVTGVPLEYILGWAEFGGLRIAVDPGVFVPRRRTGLLVDEAVAVLRPHATVVDLGCGSGAVGAALRARVDITLYAVDVDPAAVACARRNLGAGVLHGDLYDALPDHLRGRLDVVVANAPYVPTEAIALMPAEAREHEHRIALDGGATGLDVLNRVVAGAPDWLAPGGHLLVECGADQAVAVGAAMPRHGLTTRTRHSDELAATVVIGRLASAPVGAAAPTVG